MNIKDLFYLQKNDRQALFALLAILIVCLTLVVVIGSSDDGKEANQVLVQQATSKHPVYYQNEGKVHELFPFDPNTTDSTCFKRLGLGSWQIRSIYRFREKGGIFSRPSDFARVYGITKKTYEALLPFIRIADDFKQASEFYGNERYERGRRRYTPYYNNRVNYGKNDDASESQKPDRKASNAPGQETKVYSYPHKLKAGEHIAINRADTMELMKIPGIGSYYARTIVKYRDKLGGFASAEQLAEIEGFPESAIAFIQIDADNIHRLNINKLTLNQLRNHPYLNFYQAKEICDYRRQRGPIKSLDELKLLKDFPPDEIERLKPYICF